MEFDDFEDEYEVFKLNYEKKLEEVLGITYTKS